MWFTCCVVAILVVWLTGCVVVLVHWLYWLCQTYVTGCLVPLGEIARQCSSCEEGWYLIMTLTVSSSSLIMRIHTHVTMECRSCSKYCSFTSVHSCCRSSWPHLFLLTASSVTSCIHSEQTITHDSVSAIASTPSIVSKILMAASKCVLSCWSVLSCENNMIELLQQ